MFIDSWSDRLNQRGDWIEAQKIDQLRRLELEGDAKGIRSVMERDGGYFLDAVVQAMRGDIYHHGDDAIFEEAEADDFEEWFYNLYDVSGA